MGTFGRNAAMKASVQTMGRQGTLFLGLILLDKGFLNLIGTGVGV